MKCRQIWHHVVVRGTGGLEAGDKNCSVFLHILWSQLLIWWIEGVVANVHSGNLVWFERIVRALPILSNILCTSSYASKITYHMARELEIHLDSFDQERVPCLPPLLLVGLVFQNKMRSRRKLFFILSGRQEKGESGRWDRHTHSKKDEGSTRGTEKGHSVVVFTLVWKCMLRSSEQAFLI